MQATTETTANRLHAGIRCRRLLAIAALMLAPAVMRAASEGATNALPNGSFGEQTPSLAGWRADYTADRNRWYKQNHKYVSIVPRDGVHRNVLRLHVATKVLADNQGVKVDSVPVPYEPGARYRLTVAARSTGPDARILIEGYQWRPGIKPHAKPDFHALRMVYRQGGGRMLYFGNRTNGAFSGAQRKWLKGSCVFPGPDLSSAARRHLKRVRFIAVHIVGIGGGAGDLCVDDVRLERLPEDDGTMP